MDTNQLSFLLDQKFETAAKRSENHIDTSIKGLREEMENIESKHDKKHTATNEALAKLESKINNAVESFIITAASSASNSRCHNILCHYQIAAEPTLDLPVAPDSGYNSAPDPARLKLFAMLPTTTAFATKGAQAMCDKADITERTIPSLHWETQHLPVRLPSTLLEEMRRPMQPGPAKPRLASVVPTVTGLSLQYPLLQMGTLKLTSILTKIPKQKELRSCQKSFSKLLKLRIKKKVYGPCNRDPQIGVDPYCLYYCPHRLRDFT